jgi:hypothetical protein
MFVPRQEQSHEILMHQLVCSFEALNYIGEK